MLNEVLDLIRKDSGPSYLKSIMSESKNLYSPTGWCEYKKPIPETDEYRTESSGLQATARMLQSTGDEDLQLIIWLAATVRQLKKGYYRFLENNTLVFLSRIEAECRTVLEEAGIGWWDKNDRILTPTIRGQMYYSFENPESIAKYLTKVLADHQSYQVCKIERR